MLQGIIVRLYPKKDQAVVMNKTLGCCRVIYNQCLNLKINSYETEKKVENLSTLGQFIHHDLMNNPEFFYLKELPITKLYHQEIRKVLTAYKNFFTQHTGYPKFKSKNDNELSCTYELGAISKKNDYSTHKLSLAGLKDVKFKCSKKYAEYLQTYKKNIKSATLTKLPCGEYYLSILVDGPLIKQVSDADGCVGIDLGVKEQLITSDGKKYENKHFAKKQSKLLKRRQRQVARKEKGSKNRDKARKILAKTHKKITNQKKNYLHEITNELINENQVICMEDLNVKGMMKNHKLAGAIQEVNLGELRRILEYKCKWYGRELIFVGRWYPSSKTCHECGHVNHDLKLSDRVWICPHCGAVIDRDVNAALNILDEGLRLRESQSQ